MKTTANQRTILRMIKLGRVFASPGAYFAEGITLERYSVRDIETMIGSGLVRAVPDMISAPVQMGLTGRGDALLEALER